MDTLNDMVFGTMYYQHSWSKQESILLFDKAYKIKITAQAYKGDGITDSQRESYKNYRNFLENNKEKIEQELLKYSQKFYECNESLETILTPTEILFEKDGSWGVLFESRCDQEHGLAFFVKDNKVLIDSQDIFL